MSPVSDSRSVLVAKAVVVLIGVGLFLSPRAAPVALAAALAGALFAFVVAHRFGARLHLRGGLALGALTFGLGLLIHRLLVEWTLPLDGATTLLIAEAVLLGFVCAGSVFALRLLSSRVRGFSIVELALVVGAVSLGLSAHRYQRIHQPRFFSDWAWSRGMDPQTLLAVIGVVTVAVASLLLLRAQRGARALVLFALLLLFGAVASSVAEPERSDRDVETNGLPLTKSDGESGEGQKGEGGGKGEGEGEGGGKSDSPDSSKPPDPIAVVLLQDDLPEDEVLYFRQTARSRLQGDRLVEESAGPLAPDLLVGLPSAGKPLTASSPQAPAFHRRIRTSMFLLADHAQLPGLAHPVEMKALENPDPRRFVTAYEVSSQFLVRPIHRMLGRDAFPAGWSDAQRQHYLAVPEDPRYQELSDRLVREGDPRFVGDDVMKALVLKQYLEEKGFYSLQQKTLVGDTPTASFLFGDLRGYCVHFAHAAVFLIRSQGIPARVALGYAVQTRRRGAGSALVIYAQEAHAWPEMFLDGVGWVVLDIFPKQSDEPPAPHIEQDLESTLGELARTQPTEGAEAKPAAVSGSRVAISGLLALLALAYAVKWIRRFSGGSHRRIYRAVLDRLADRGAARQYGESREQHAARVAALAPSFTALTQLHLRCALRTDDATAQLKPLARATARELSKSGPWHLRAAAALNPIGWCFTR